MISLITLIYYISNLFLNPKTFDVWLSLSLSLSSIIAPPTLFHLYRLPTEGKQIKTKLNKKPSRIKNQAQYQIW